MKPAPFDYFRADTVEHACQLLVDAGEDARLLAGGQSLIAMMNLRLARPSALVDIGRLPLSNIDVGSDRVTIGSLARHRQVLEHEGLRVLRVPGQAIAASLPATETTSAEDHIWLIDPLGHLMMRFPRDADPNRIKKDVAKVLRASQVG